MQSRYSNRIQTASEETEMLCPMRLEVDRAESNLFQASACRKEKLTEDSFPTAGRRMLK